METIVSPVRGFSNRPSPGLSPKRLETVRDELAELCDELRYRQNLVWGNDAEGEGLLILEDFGDAHRLLSLERLVERIARGTALTFGPSLRRDRKKEELDRLKDDYLKVKRAAELFSDQYSYSVYLTELFEVINEVGLSSPGLTDRYGDLSFLPREGEVPEGMPPVKFQWELFDELVAKLGARLTTGRVKTALRVRKAGAERNFNDAIAYLDQCFEAYPHLYVLRLDLAYQPRLSPNSGNDHIGNGLRRIRQDAARLFKKVGGGRWHPELFGYLAKLEYGKSRGHFIHLVALLDASKTIREKDWFERISQLWGQLTQGEGITHNCNQEKRLEKDESGSATAEQGVGLMTRGSARYRAFESRVLAYVTKSSRFLRVRVESGERRYFKGGKPRKARVTRAGEGI